MRKRRMIVVSAVLVAAVMAGWKWGGRAQGNAGIECSPYCNVKPPIGQLPEPGPCFYHGGVVWVVRLGPFLYYGCVDGNVIEVDA